MENTENKDLKLQIQYVPVSVPKPSEYNPRKFSKDAFEQLKTSLREHSLVEPLVLNSAPNRNNILIGGHGRLRAAQSIGLTTVPVVYVNIPDLETEKALNIRLNKAVGDFDLELLLKNFSEEFLSGVGFSSEDLDIIFDLGDTPEVFDLEKELKKLKIDEIRVKKGDVYEIAGCRIMNGDSMNEADMLKLMNGEKADMCFTDPPYILDYLHGKSRNGKPTEGFGLKRNRNYLGTTELPENFTELWMVNIVKIQKPDFSIIVYENPKNLRTIWNALEKWWRYRNTLIWHIPNRVQGFSSKYKLFNKHDFAILGTSGEVALNDEPENDVLLQETYETALFAISGHPHWEKYGKNKKYCPTDFVDYKASDEKSSGQAIVFGTKPLEIIIPYLKILTKRGDLIIEPFGGSGSTAASAIKLKRRCNVMEKSNVYMEVIINRLEKLTGQKAKKVS